VRNGFKYNEFLYVNLWRIKMIKLTQNDICDGGGGYGLLQLMKSPLSPQMPLQFINSKKEQL